MQQLKIASTLFEHRIGDKAYNPASTLVSITARSRPLFKPEAGQNFSGFPEGHRPSQW